MLTPQRRRVVTITAAALIAGALVGCSSDDGSSDAAADGTADTATVASNGSVTIATTPATTKAPVDPTVPATDAPADTAAADPDAESTTTTTSVPLPPYDFSTISPIVQAFVDAEGLNGAGLIIVDRDHGVIHQDYWGEFDAERISLVASSSKMITAGVLLHLADQGLLDMDAPVADVVDWGVGNPTITPAQLVSNSSGLVGLIDGLAFPSYLCQFGVAGTMQGCAEQIFTTPDDDASVLPPDTEFRYGGAQWQIAGAVAEAASGKSWAELIEEIYVEPCELETLAYTNQWGQRQIREAGSDLASFLMYPTLFNADPSTLLPTDNPNMEGGAYLTTGDYAKLLLMHLRGGLCDDTQVLSQAALDEAHADRTGAVFGGAVGYGMGWWVDRTSGRLTDPGAYGAFPWLDLDDGYGAYLVIEADTATGARLATQLYDPIDAAIAAAES